MGMNFPNTPSQGQVFTPVGGYQYVYIDGAWRMIASPSQLVTAESRNRIVNGAMQHSQENGTTASPTAVTGTYYPADQWLGQWSLTGTAYVNWDNASWFSVSGFHINAFIGGTATPSPAAGAYLMLTQKIEGLRVADLKWGTASAKQVVLRFTCASDVPGTYCVQVTNADTSRSFLAPFTITATNVAQTFTLVIPGDVTGTWVKNNTIGLMIGITLTAGSSFIGVAGWQPGNKIAIAGNTNLAATAGKVFALGDVGFYVDPQNSSIAPRWIIPDYAEEFMACSRYWTKVSVTWGGNVTTGINYWTAAHLFRASMRIIPAAAGVSSGLAGFPATIGPTTITTEYISEGRAANATQNGGVYGTTFSLNARM